MISHSTDDDLNLNLIQVIKIKTESTSSNGFQLLDIQGTLTIPTSIQNPINLEFINDVPYITISHHRLKGKRVQLKKPLSIVRKQDGELIVEGILNEKLVFDQRPEILLKPKDSGLIRMV